MEFTAEKADNNRSVLKTRTRVGVKRIRSQVYPVLIKVFADMIAIFASYFIQYYIRFEAGWFTNPVEPEFLDIAMSSLALLMYWLVLFFFSGMYKNWYLRSPFDEIFAVFRVALVGTIIIVFFVFTDTTKSPRMLFLLYFVVFSGSVIIGRMIARRIQKMLRKRRIIAIPALVVGDLKNAVNFHNRTHMSPAWGYESIGVVAAGGDKELSGDVPVLGTIDNLGEILDKISPQEVIVSMKSPDHSRLLNIASECGDRNIRVMIEPDLYDIFTGQARAQHLYGIPLIEISTQLMKPWEEVIKRIFDIVFSLMVIVIGMPVWLLVALIIKIESRGPVFYTQPRVGKNDNVFRIFKFRSMVQDADRQKQKWTSVNDPRVTGFGKFIRKTHLDEIPQFWNVLKGDMSIVGPRPEQPQYVEEFSREIPYYKRRLKVRPGITGWWQVKYTAHILDKDEIENRLKDDFYYIENISLRLDIEIIVRTVWCVLKGHGQA
ncbi:MAG: sugar transferase [Candidatus Kapaibacterium sp.]